MAARTGARVVVFMAASVLALGSDRLGSGETSFVGLLVGNDGNHNGERWRPRERSISGVKEKE
jgi:hypothetical protein